MLRSRTLLMGILLLAAGPRLSAAPSDQQIEEWVRQLDAEEFAQREKAVESLIKAGKPAIEPVAAAAAGKSLEVTERSVRVLRELWSQGDRPTAAAARAALQKLAAGEHRQAAGKAQTILREHQQQVARKFEGAGALVTMTDRKITALTFDKVQTFGDLLDMLEEFPDVEVVHLHNPLAGDAEVAKLKVLSKLDYLNLFESSITDESLKHFKDMPALKSLPMGRTKVTDAGLAHLKGLTRLEYVGVRGDAVTDAGLAHLANLTNLEGLHLGDTKVTDAGLVHLKKMTKLRLLHLDNTAITDAGLEKLQCLQGLESLFVAGTKVTDTGIKKLREALPGVGVQRE